MVKNTLTIDEDIDKKQTSSKVIRKEMEKKKKIQKTTSTRAMSLLDQQQVEENTQSFLDKVHKAFKKINNSKPDPSNRQKEYILEKTCELCTNLHFDDHLLLCDICDDGYHTFCLVNFIKIS